MSKVLILGSNSDVGKACAEIFALNGSDIVLASRSVDENQERIAKDLQLRHSINVELAHFDAVDTGSHKSFSEKWKSDTVVSVFGILGDHEKAIAEYDHAESIINTNFLGNVSILGHIANYMEANEAGTIACVSSVAGERGRMSNYIYGASKAALTAFLSGLRNRLAHKNVHVLSVQPGFINTKMVAGIDTPAPLTASAEQVAKAIFKGCVKKKNTVFVKPVWRLVMLVIRNIPEFIFKKLKL